MFQFFRKHQAWGLIFIGIVIVSFVIFFSPDQRFSGRHAAGHENLGSINGHSVSRAAYREAAREARLGFFLRFGEWPGVGQAARQVGFDENREALNRLALLEEARKLGIVVDDQVVAGSIVEMPFLRDEQTGTFQRQRYDNFVENVLRREGYTRAEFETFLMHEIALEHLGNVGGLSGLLVTPREAEARYRAENEQLAAQIVIFSATNYVDQVDLSPEAVARYYTNNLAGYRIPERVQIRYVRFDTTNFQAEVDQHLNSVTNLQALLDAEYQRRGAASFKDEQGQILTQEAAREQMKQQYRHSLAVEAARKKANEFANELYQREPNPESLSQLAAEKGYTVEISAPFDQFRGPVEIGLPQALGRAAFALTPDEPFATPLIGNDAVYVYAFHQRLPSEYQPLEAVREQATEALKRSAARERAEEAGRKFARALSEALAGGKTFDAVCTEAGVKPVGLPVFSRATRTLSELGPRLTIQQLLDAAAEVAPGKGSDFVRAADGGFVLYVQSRIPVSEEQFRSEITNYLAEQQRAGRFEAVTAWQRSRLQAARILIPGSGTTNGPPPAVN